MSSRIYAIFTSGVTLYAVIRNQTGQVWNGSAFENYNAANWSTYAVAMTEQGTTGYYAAATPALAFGAYHYEAHQRAGGSSAVTDATVWIDEFEHSGSAISTAIRRTAAGYVIAADAVESGDKLATTASIGRVVHNGSRVLYVSTSGSDSNDGLTPATAKATLESLIGDAAPVAQAGDTIIVGPGEWELQDLLRIAVADVTIRGAGINATRLYGNVSDLGNGSKQYLLCIDAARVTVSDLELHAEGQGFPTTDGTGIRMSSTTSPVDRPTLERVRIYARADTLRGYWTNIHAVDCDFRGSWDVLVPDGDNTGMFLRCLFHADAANAVGYPIHADVGNASHLFVDCTATTTATTSAARVARVAGTNSATFVNCTLNMPNAPSGKVVEVVAGTCILSGCAFDGSKVQGTVSLLNPTADVRLIEGSTTKVGYLDGSILSRLAAASYTAPDNAGIASAASSAATAASQATSAATNSGTLLTNLATLAGKFTGITSVAHWLRALFLKRTPDATAIAEINTGGGTFDPATDAPEAIREKVDTIPTSGGTGNGDVPVNHNYGGADALRIMSGSTPIDGAIITAWEESAYPAGQANGQTTTGSDGRWIAPLNLDAGRYVVVVKARGFREYRVGSGAAGSEILTVA